MEYVCIDNMKFDRDFTQISVSATCLTDNEFDAPDPWPSCKPSNKLHQLLISKKNERQIVACSIRYKLILLGVCLLLNCSKITGALGKISVF